MTDYLLLFPILVSFFVTLFLVPYWIRKAWQIGLVWDDMNKAKKRKVAGSGGIAAILGFISGGLITIAYKVFFIDGAEANLVQTFALISVILILAGVGLIDDLIGWQHGGLSKRSRMVLILFAAIPLVVINAGRSIVNVPLWGNVDLGLLYPLVFIPLGIVGASTTFNFLAGLNGLEAGQGVILLAGMSLVAYFTGSTWLALIGLCMIFSLLAFLIYNYYPAQVFPGDSLTYCVGCLIATIAILGNFEKIAVFLFIPLGIETILKLRGGLEKHSFGKPNKDASLSLKYDKIYSLNHLAIYLLNKCGVKPTEKRVVWAIWLFEAIWVALVLFIFREGIFR